MIFRQKSILVILLAVLFICVLSYEYVVYNDEIYRKCLSSIMYYALSVFSIAYVLCLFLMKKWQNIWLNLYVSVGLLLILFFILSIFILKINDLFFWEADRLIQKEFFKFSFNLIGYNYLLAIPYLVLLICESAFLSKGSFFDKETH